MSTCRFCSLFRFWSKFLTALLLLVAGSQFSVWVNNHQVEPKYQEPLSAKQQAMKDAYLAARLVPEILVTKDGTKLYYNSKSHQAEVKKPAWLGDSGEIVLTVFEKWDIAREGIVTEKIFGLETKSTLSLRRFCLPVVFCLVWQPRYLDGIAKVLCMCFISDLVFAWYPSISFWVQIPF